MRLMTIIHSSTYYFGNESIASLLILGHLLKTDIKESSFLLDFDTSNANKSPCNSDLVHGGP